MTEKRNHFFVSFEEKKTLLKLDFILKVHSTSLLIHLALMMVEICRVCMTMLVNSML
jgi:hypothetical protein